MKVIRELGIYKRREGTHIKSIAINMSLDTLIELFSIDIKKDPNVYMVYEVNEKQYLKLCYAIPELLIFTLEEYSIYYECFQGSDWSED